jgi:hypothetical protein
VGLVVGEREPFPPLARALLDTARRSDTSISQLLERALPRALS